MWYPKNAIELEDKLHTDEQCLEYLFQLRWPSGYKCLKCESSSYWIKSRGRFECKDCHYESSVLVGTIFEGSNIKLRVWFRAIWWLVSEKNGTSALSLQRNLGLGSYRTAWQMLHKLRDAMVRVDRSKLSGEVEFDEFYLGGKSQSVNRADSKNKLLLTIGVEVVGRGSGRIRIDHIERINTNTVVTSVCNLVESGSLVITDGFGGYNHIESRGYRHRAHNQTKQKGQDFDDDSRLPRAHRVISLLKRWYYGTLQGKMSKKYSKSYIEEFVFRYNRRTSKARGLLFLRVLENGILLKSKTYRDRIKSI